jgi:membrane-associated phospholipid phosphatase
MAQEGGLNPSKIPQHNEDTFGRILSSIFHPIPMNVLTFLIAGYFGHENPLIGLAWGGICVLALVVPISVFFVIRLRQGAYGDADVSQRQQRNELYTVGFIWLIVATAILIPLGVPMAILAVIIIAIIQGIIGGLVNLFWKISVHAGSVATTSTVALLYMRSLGIVLWLCALTVGWARIRTRNHTPSQVLAGFVVAAITVIAVFQLFFGGMS